MEIAESQELIKTLESEILRLKELEEEIGSQEEEQAKFEKELEENHGKKADEDFNRIICRENWALPLKYLYRKNNGLPGEMDAVKGAGNAVVPYIPEMIFRRLKTVFDLGERE
jgi:hypothetical protein